MPGDGRTASAKIVVAGGFGAGKTTTIGAVSDIPPLRTEARITTASQGIDDLTHVREKSTTTVAMDFGRVSLADDLVLYLFGTPGQDRFWFMWDDLVQGAIGAVVVVDTRRLADSFGPVDYFEARGLPFVVALNAFDGHSPYTPEQVRQALGLGLAVPVLLCDARRRTDVVPVLISVVEQALLAHCRTDGAV
ncbi:ATP/GTP-binding protein [Streptomyces sp. WAC06614]|uniref:GTP-binding protein n=1 Tax=Streptomyces sp. WAC06614 TaxID=2487416 RepID=UPI000F783069|nr:ATP/GTP-binding protein [Streptomyces sp. WAC06614]RSS75508.1 ATP-binding protein [Streptomyces sp. WAC06614]